MTFILNPLLKTDSYKLSHRVMYPEGTTNVLSNFTPRGSRIPGVNHMVNFSLQAFLVDLMADFDTFFKASKEAVVEEYRQFTSTFVAPGFDLKAIEDLHDLGYLPVRFSQIAEGTLVPMRVPTITIESTAPMGFWLVNYLESNLSASIWHPATSATTAWNLRRKMNAGAAKTSDSPEATDFQLHDFSYRGMENWQAAAASSAGHCLSSFGSDTVPVVPWVNHYYPGEDNGLIAASIPATEHSVMCAGGKENELQTVSRLLDLFPEGLLSVVMDTWDWEAVIERGGLLEQLKDKIMARNGKLVIRPDSGDPVKIVTGEVTANGLLPNGSTMQKGGIEALYDIFGGTVNSKGYIELDPHIGLIYGDSINLERVEQINARLAAKGFATTNWVAGVGSFSYQFVTRDTFGSAVKATQVTINGVATDIFKSPKTDDGLKKSATGRLAVLPNGGGTLQLVERASAEQEAQSLIKPVWENGDFLPGMKLSYAQVRANLARSTAELEASGNLS